METNLINQKLVSAEKQKVEVPHPLCCPGRGSTQYRLTHTLLPSLPTFSLFYPLMDNHHATIDMGLGVNFARVRQWFMFQDRSFLLFSLRISSYFASDPITMTIKNTSKDMHSCLVSDNRIISILVTSSCMLIIHRSRINITVQIDIVCLQRMSRDCYCLLMRDKCVTITTRIPNNLHELNSDTKLNSKPLMCLLTMARIGKQMTVTFRDVYNDNASNVVGSAGTRHTLTDIGEVEDGVRVGYRNGPNHLTYSNRDESYPGVDWRLLEIAHLLELEITLQYPWRLTTYQPGLTVRYCRQRPWACSICKTAKSPPHLAYRATTSTPRNVLCTRLYLCCYLPAGVNIAQYTPPALLTSLHTCHSSPHHRRQERCRTSA
ncbi:hypothetical protein J6590_071338 [Homalodisca vitripennis]|nr:hypothetical protein J6590_071338 [Homalodisca vitripennis]